MDDRVFAKKVHSNVIDVPIIIWVDINKKSEFIDAVKNWIIRSLDIGPSRFLILLYLGITNNHWNKRSPAYSRGCCWRSWRAACSAWPWQVQAGGAPVVALRQMSLGGKLRRQLEAWGEASSGLWRPPRRACPTASSFLTIPPSSRNPKHSPWQETGRFGPRLGPGNCATARVSVGLVDVHNIFSIFTFIAKDIKARNTKKWRKKALFYGNLATVKINVCLKFFHSGGVFVKLQGRTKTLA